MRFNFISFASVPITKSLLEKKVWTANYEQKICEWDQYPCPMQLAMQFAICFSCWVLGIFTFSCISLHLLNVRVNYDNHKEYAQPMVRGCKRQKLQRRPQYRLHKGKLGAKWFSQAQTVHNLRIHTSHMLYWQKLKKKGQRSFIKVLDYQLY